LIIWAGLKAHRRKLVREHLDSTDSVVQAGSCRRTRTWTPSNTCGRGSSG